MLFIFYRQINMFTHIKAKYVSVLKYALILEYQQTTNKTDLNICIISM